MWIYLVNSNKFSIFASVKQKVTDITDAISSLAKQIESMQEAIDSQHATICQINRTSQGQLKEIGFKEASQKERQGKRGASQAPIILRTS